MKAYGEELSSTANDREKFGTFVRDSYTGLDISPNRAYASTYGRFNTADPYQASGGPSSPDSWNRYSYSAGDPINKFDPSGLLAARSDTGYCSPALESCDDDISSGLSLSPCNFLAGLGFVAIPGPGCYAPEAAAKVINHKPQCQDDWDRIDQTLTDIGSNILALARGIDGWTSEQNSLLAQDIATDVKSEMSDIVGSGTGRGAKTPNYRGGHFNLTLSATDLAGLGSGLPGFLAMFGGKADGTRQAAIAGSPNDLRYALHSKQIGTGGIQFHFDRFNPLGDVAGAIGHGIYDVGYGSLAHPCLDPAWH